MLHSLGVEMTLISGMYSHDNFEFEFTDEMLEPIVVDGQTLSPYAILTG